MSVLFKPDPKSPAELRKKYLRPELMPFGTVAAVTQGLASQGTGPEAGKVGGHGSNACASSCTD